MKVTQNNSPIQLDAYIKQMQQQRQQQQTAIEQSSATQPNRTDTVQLSDEAKRVQQSVQAQEQSGEIRQDKVQQVKMDIEKGNYRVDAAKIATDMLQETFQNNKVLNQIDTRA